MASSSVSQESLDMEEFEHQARRNRIRVHRGHSGRGTVPFRGLPDRGGDGFEVDKDNKSDHTGENGDHVTNTLGLSAHSHLPGGDHESPTRSAAARLKDKRNRPNHMKGKLPKDKRKLREKRRSTGVVHCMPSTESTGDSLDDEDDTEENETKKNTSYNEGGNTGFQHSTLYEIRHSSNSPYNSPKRNKSPSDLEADLEDNQDYDSAVSHSETSLNLIGRTQSYGGTPPHSATRPPVTTPPSSSVAARTIGGLYSGSKYSPEPRRPFQFNPINSNVGTSSGADSPCATMSSTSSSSSILSRYRDQDSPRAPNTNSGQSHATHGTHNNTTGNVANSTNDPKSPRVTGNDNTTTTTNSTIDNNSNTNSNIRPRPVGFSVFKESSSHHAASKPDSGILPTSLRYPDRNTNSWAKPSDSPHSRVSGFHHSPRPFVPSNVSSTSSVLVQQNNDNITQLEQQLEKEREENKRLRQQMEEKDKKIAELQKSVELLNSECDGLDEDNLKLQEENKALIRAMAKLSADS